MEIHSIWRRITATRYTRALEAEIVRLRAENRALLNSILGIAGVPPITVPDSVAIGKDGGLLSGAMRRASEASSNNQPLASRADRKKQGVSPGPPVRKRSWHQIYRTLELDSARKKPQEIVNVPPATTTG
jgi:hypothetical protein